MVSAAAESDQEQKKLERPMAFVDPEEEAYLHAMQLVSFSALPMTLKVATELGLLQLISAAVPNHHLSSDDLAALLRPSDPLFASSMIDRILQLLASYSVLTVSHSADAVDGRSVRRYSAAPVCKYLAPSIDGAASIAGITLLLQDKILMENWYYLKDSILRGRSDQTTSSSPFEMAYGMNMFEYCGRDRRFNSLFNEGMRGNSAIIMNKVLHGRHSCGTFDDVRVLVDVGGGLGATLSMITARHPHILGINFDLPHVVSQAPPLPGVDHIGGDMFEQVPDGDAILLKWILHDWSDEQSVNVLKNCYKALPANGKVLILEYILPDSPEPTREAQVVFHADLMMLAHNPGGKERTEKEFKDLADRSGFSRFKANFIFANAWIIELQK
ncbi:Tricetin 3',4',5'-O-trimethyltransferase [Apostasia shenzhenica]|uniref:Tricetin 3',4',5'-O-trimethyltransferase n=1 Tax=Apostasia shenzhenica TaxID=1088818 RepID=A0A2H9ZSA4_9ASPA|nr:Tricetin 3',4',5'-O-trimethyltransferase [Apostasia shenzhenica]